MATGFQESDVLVIGLGGHKCGSTWLYRYFLDHPECFAPLIKELAYFADEGNQDWLWRTKGRANLILNAVTDYENVAKSSDAVPRDVQTHYDEMRAQVFDLSQNMASLTREAPYAANFARKTLEQTRMIDITPMYALMNDQTYAQMTQAHSDVRFIFMMRDPAERVFSAFRYAFKRRGKGLAPRPGPRLQQIQDWLGKTEKPDMQTDYPSILDKMERQIADDKRLVLFYENLFCDESIKTICAFLGIRFIAGKYQKRIHQTTPDDKAVKMHDIEREFLVERYRYVYKEVKSRFGAEAPSQWNWPEGL